MEAQLSTREASLWKWLKDGTRHLFPDLDLRRVENVVERGTPDVEGCWEGRQFWIELKCVGFPRYVDERIGVRFEPAQLPWLRRRARAGGACHVLVQVGSGQKARRYLVPGFHLTQVFVEVDGEHHTTERRLNGHSWTAHFAAPTDVLAAAAIDAERWRHLLKATG